MSAAPMRQRVRDLFRPKWRLLTQTAIAAIGGGEAERRQLERLAKAARTDWPMPTEDRAEGFLCMALFSLSRAFAERDAGAAWREAMAPCLRGLAEALGDVLDATAPAEAAAPQRPWRADIDG